MSPTPVKKKKLQVARKKLKRRSGVFLNNLTLTVSLYESGKGWPSWGLTILYFPTVIELLLMSSAMHFVFPDSSSKRIDFDVEDKIAITVVIRRR
jgi:hypothetical protein